MAQKEQAKLVYYHRGCNGEIPMSLPVKCRKCGHKWPASTLLKYPVPKDMYMARPVTTGFTSHAGWADKKGLSFAGQVARYMPDVPRKWRIGILLVTLGVVAAIIVAISRC